MQFHAYALAESGVAVDLVGLSGAAPAAAVGSHPRITCHAVVDRQTSGAFASTIGRVARIGVSFTRCLSTLPAPDVVLVQLPPAVPGAVCAWAWARWHRARLVIDWHNLGWTLLQLGAWRAEAVSGLRAIERWLGRRGDGHLAVSKALSSHVATWLDLPDVPRVLYDRAPEWLRPADAGTAARLRACLLAAHDMPAADSVLLVSPTSWTRDEAMDLLFDAADAIERRVGAVPDLPHVLFLATGQGPGRALFDARVVARRRGGRVTVASTWVAADDYPALLTAADAGVCLHRSSSGLDLPMKIADMHGVGLPVLALRYPALTERLTDGVNAMMFDDAATLAELVASWWSSGASQRQALLATSAAAEGERWLDGWAREARALLLRESDA